MPFSLAIAALVLLQTWVLRPSAGQRWVPLVAASVIAIGVLHARRSLDWGWSSRAFAPALLAAAVWTLALAAALGVWLGVARLQDVSFDGLGRLLVWGAAQQWLLHTTLLREAERYLPGRFGWLAAPALFGVLHLPNPFLTISTTIAAMGWCAIYRRFPNVVPLAISHAVGTRVILGVFDDPTGRLRVGAAYLGL